MSQRVALHMLWILVASTGSIAQTAADSGGLSFVLSGAPTAELLAWASNLGIETSRLAPGDDLAVKGLIAQQDIVSGSIVITMTRANSLRVVDNQTTPFADLVPADIWNACSQHMQLGLLLLREVKRGSASRFNTWIQTLPTTFDTLGHWSSAEMDQLQTGTMPGEQLKAKVEQQRSEMERDISIVGHAPLVANLSLTPEDLSWALEIVSTRSFSGPKRLELFNALGLGFISMFATVLFRIPPLKSWKGSPQAATYTWQAFVSCMLAVWLMNRWRKQGEFENTLLPVIDLINHRSTGQGCMEGGRFTNNVKCVLYEGFKAGEEVFHSYGEKNNEDLLTFYGFVEENNVHDYYTADLLHFLKARGNVTAEWTEAVESSRYAAKLEKAQLRADGWSDSTMQSLRSVLSPLTDEAGNSRLQLEQQVFQVLQDFCKEAIASKPTTLEEDDLQLQGLRDDAEAHPRMLMALQFRMSTKQLLNNCVWQYEQSEAGL